MLSATPVTLVGGTGYYWTATFTAAAAAYSANDIVSTAKSAQWLDVAGNIFPGGHLVILTASLLIAETGLQSGEAAYTLQKYNVTPPSAHADNAAWDLPAGDRTSYQGPTSLGTPVDVGSSLFVKTSGINESIIVPTTGLTFAELVTVGGATLTATDRKVVLFGVPA